jgi:biopolymer transport protein ExbB
VSRQSLEAQEYYEAQNTGVWDEATFKQVITRAMRGALDEETTRCESGLTALATIGSTAPFVGLFGTVWGIYSALIHIGVSGAGTLDKIAAPVGEALIMTGFGLFVAIPAVIAYNGFMRVNRVWLARLDRFAYEWWELLLQYARQSGKR